MLPRAAVVRHHDGDRAVLSFSPERFLRVTGGEVRGTVTNPSKRGPAFIGKLGYDRQENDDERGYNTCSQAQCGGDVSEFDTKTGSWTRSIVA